MIEQSGILSQDEGSKLVVFNNACRTGNLAALLQSLLNLAATEYLELLCRNISPTMVKTMRENIVQGNWKGWTADVINGQVCFLS